MKRLLAALLIFLTLCGCQQAGQQETSDDPLPQQTRKEVSFLAAGDNLIHGLIYESGLQEDGSYAFEEMYARVKPQIAAADVAVLNQETVCGGSELGLSSYPAFNSPVEILDAAADAGFDWLTTSTNHAMDLGEQAIVNQLQHIRTHHPQMVVTGTHDSEQDAGQLRVIVRNDVRIGMLSYTYGHNGIALPDGKEYLVDLIDVEKIAADLAALNEVSDVQIVGMHWGSEYQFEPDEQQRDLAQQLSDMGADVIIGTHPHVLQPIEVISGEQGNDTLVLYSLGNFVSAQDVNSRMLGGMAKWTLVYEPQTKAVSIEDVRFEPTVMFFDAAGKDVQVWPLSQYDDTLAARHLLSQQGEDMSKRYFTDLCREIMGGMMEEEDEDVRAKSDRI